MIRGLNKLWPRQLWSQINWLILLLILLGGTFLAVFTGQRQARQIAESLQTTAEALARNMAIDSANHVLNQDYASLEILLQQYATLPDLTKVAVVDLTGAPLSQVARVDGEVSVIFDTATYAVPNLENASVNVVQNQVVSVWQPISFSTQALGFLNLEMSLASGRQIQIELFRDILIVGIIAIILCIILFYFYLRRPLQALRAASQFAEKLDERKGETLAVSKFSNEFETLGNALNAVSERLYSQEQKLKQSNKELQERLSAVLTYAVDGIITLTLDNNFSVLSFNPAAERLFGYAEESIKGQKVERLFQDPASFLEGLEGEAKTITLNAKHVEGNSIPVEVSTSFIDIDRSPFYLTIIRDISERVQFQKALQASEQEAKKLALVASRTNNAVIITDAKGLVEWVNEGFSTLTGYSLAEIKGQKPGDLLQGKDSDPDVVRHIQAQLAKGEGFDVEIINYAKSGRKYWVEIEAQPVYDEEGNISNFIAIESDVTEKKQARLELLEAKEIAENANQAKSEFLSRMSHELRTPLNAILGFAQLLELDELTDDQTESVDRILKAGKHLLDLINEVLDISRIEAGTLSLSLEPVPVYDVLQESVNLIKPLAAKRQISIELSSLSEKQVLVTADLQRLKQVMLNLLSNAVKYNRDGGHVFVSCHVREETVQVVVKDTGLGLSDDKVQRLFTPFDRLGAEETAVEGSGIGLALSQRLMEVMNGQIGVETAVGQGSSFWIELEQSVTPSSSQPVYQEHFPPSGATALYRQPKIVYVEDNLSNLALVQKVFARATNAELLTAMQGQLGLELIQEQKPDLILLDLHLPGLSGEEVLDRLKEDPSVKHIPVVILSADANPKRIKRIKAKGVIAYLTKPINVQELLSVVESTLKETS